MTKAERQKIYDLLAAYYPNSKMLNHKTATAWGLVLERYEYEPVKQSVIEYASHGKYFPDLADIVGNLDITEKARRDADAKALEKYMKWGDRP